MTGIQALEHKYPAEPAIPGKATYMEFEYIHHGTTSLTDFFYVAIGSMEMPYLNPPHTEEDFVETMCALIETEPRGIMDICQ